MALTFVPGVKILGEHIHVIEKSAFDKAVAGLKRISKTRTRDPLAIEYRKIARETLKELGELK